MVVIGASIGIMVSPGGSYAHLGAGAARADLAMYKAKEAGRACMTLYDPAMDADREERNGAGTRPAPGDRGRGPDACLPAADRRRQQREESGVEALVRWNRPGHGRCRPMFIPVAETSAAGLSDGSKAVRETAKQMAGTEDAVNVSPGQFRQSGLHRLRTVLAADGDRGQTGDARGDRGCY